MTVDLLPDIIFSEINSVSLGTCLFRKLGKHLVEELYSKLLVLFL